MFYKNQYAVTNKSVDHFEMFVPFLLAYYYINFPFFIAVNEFIQIVDLFYDMLEIMHNGQDTINY